MNKELEEILQRMFTKIQTINDRTKRHTLDIKKLEKQVKKLNKESCIKEE